MGTALQRNILYETELLVRIDDECRRLQALDSAAAVRLGRVLKVLSQPGIEGKPRYQELGFGTFDHLCRGRLEVSGRTGQRWRQLADAEKHPSVWEAFLAGRINQTKALQLLDYLKKHPDEEGVVVEQAQRFTAAQLHERLKDAQSDDEREEVVRCVLRLGPDDRRLFCRAIERVRQMVGYDVDISTAWELLLAELASGLRLPELDAGPDDFPTLLWHRGRRIEEELEASYRGWDFLGDRVYAVDLLERPLPVGAEALAREAVSLLLTIQQVELEIGDLLWCLDQHDTPCFRNIGHFAQSRLGFSDSKARNLVRRSRCLARQPQVKQWLMEARISLTRFDMVMPLIERGCDGMLYARFAYKTERQRLSHLTGQLNELSDEGLEAWHQRVPTEIDLGLTCPEWVRRAHRDGLDAMQRDYTVGVLSKYACLAVVTVLAGLGMLEELVACQSLSPGAGRWVTSVLYLSPETALLQSRLIAAFEMAYGEEISFAFFVVLACTLFLKHNSNDGLKGQTRKLMQRDLYRCTVPDCGRRLHLHGHHLEFRSHGGSDVLTNKTTACQCCHGLVHRGHIYVKGNAPNDLIWKRTDEVFEGTPNRHWSLGRRYTGPRPTSEIRVAIQDRVLLVELGREVPAAGP